MNPCIPPQFRPHRVLAARPRGATHYVASHKSHAVAGHHVASGAPVGHLPVVHHPRPPAHHHLHHPVHHHAHRHVHHHAPPPAPGACGTGDIAGRLRPDAGVGSVFGMAPGGGMMLGGLAIGGGLAGLGGAAMLAGGGTPWFGGGSNSPAIGPAAPVSGGSGPGSPLPGAPGSPGGGGGPGGGPPEIPVPNVAVPPQADTPPVHVPEPSSLLVLAAALLALALTRWSRAAARPCRSPARSRTRPRR